LPAPEVQYHVVDEYGFVLARVDLAYPAARLAIEYDGATHFNRGRA
jgi:very-short-patch-repair endonuclease